ncbi:MAG: pyridoxamine 5'-phosphate oxidase family protein [Trebonia sp.]
MRWSDMERAQPRLARLGRQRLIEPGVLLVATIRSDGSPRIGAVEPLLLDGSLWLGMMWQSGKARDLLRDPRVLVHSVITGREGSDGEFKIRGTVRADDDPVTFQRYADTVAGQLGWRPEHWRMHLFEVDISDVTFIVYSESGDQHVAMWPPSREYVRPNATATSLGDPEPAADILVSA